MQSTIKELTLSRLDTKKLWVLINKGWSVKSAYYSHSKKEFKIALHKEAWPDILLTCPLCNNRNFPSNFIFKANGDYFCREHDKRE
jgi:hypothetical protein